MESDHNNIKICRNVCVTLMPFAFSGLTKLDIPELVRFTHHSTALLMLSICLLWLI